MAMLNLSERALGTLADLVPTYVWWKTPDVALRKPGRIIAQVMNLGTPDDVEILTAAVGVDALRDVLTHAEAGQFYPEKWAHWHVRLGLSAADEVPPLPIRTFE